MKNIFDDIWESQMIIRKLKPTFCGELSSLFTKGIKDSRFKVKESYYNAFGVNMVIEDSENQQTYEINIKVGKNESK